MPVAQRLRRRPRRRRVRTRTTRLLGHAVTLATDGPSVRLACAVLILLPPERGQGRAAPGQAARPRRRCPPRRSPTPRAVLDALVDLCRADPERGRDGASGLGPPSCRPGRAATPACARAPTARADPIYTGVLYDALGLTALCPPPPGAGRRPGSRSSSSLFGLVRPGDRIPAYRLSGDASLPGLGSVAGIWRDPRPGRSREAARPRAAGRPPVHDVRRVLAAAGPTSRRGWRPCGCCTRSDGRRTGGQPLQQGHQGPDRPRAARGRRATRAPRRRLADLLARPRLDRRGRSARPAGHPARRGRQRGLKRAHQRGGRVEQVDAGGQRVVEPHRRSGGSPPWPGLAEERDAP